VRIAWPRRRALGPSLAALLLLWPAVSAAETPTGTPSTQDASLAGGRPASGPSLFISPAGQPFRAAPGEPYPVGRWFAQVDRNGDGRIDRAEFRADAEAFFHALDINRDGVVDGFEIANYESTVVPEILGAYGAPPGQGDATVHRARPSPDAGSRRRGRGGARDGDAGDVVMGGATAYELLSVPEPVAAADANLTGRVTLADFMVAADRRFARLDGKGQGYLTLADLPMTPVQRAAERQAKERRGS
jgi:hypothetical protein